MAIIHDFRSLVCVWFLRVGPEKMFKLEYDLAKTVADVENCLNDFLPIIGKRLKSG